MGGQKELKKYPEGSKEHRWPEGTKKTPRGSKLQRNTGGQKELKTIAQGRNHRKMLAATSAMVGRICPPWLR